MIPIGQVDIQNRIARDNPWWTDGRVPEGDLPRRVYFKHFARLALNLKVRRATVLLGPRRVGKTVIVKQLAHEAMQQGIAHDDILYAAIDAPVYSGMSLEAFVKLLPNADSKSQKLIIFDEIQYLRNWEIHLKDLVDTLGNVKFVATGSAAAALRLQSQESGAGRFSNFMLPPLTFFEFLCFKECDEQMISVVDNKYHANDINKLNEHFVDYLNFGGYPEAVLNEEIRKNPEQFIRNDIIDKVLLKDLPSLYGINDIQELNRLFSFLAYNAGNEASLESISQESGISKPTIKRYIEYLESAFLIIKVATVDDNCKSMKRERNFKVYLNNPSMRAALFTPVDNDNTTLIGHLAESAVFSQWQHSLSFRLLRYARWRNEGEVDVVYLSGDQNPDWIGEVKWSDSVSNNISRELKHMNVLLKRHKSIRSAFFTTKTYQTTFQTENIEVKLIPTALYCYTVGRNITNNLAIVMPSLRELKRQEDQEEDGAANAE